MTSALKLQSTDFLKDISSWSLDSINYVNESITTDPTRQLVQYLDSLDHILKLLCRYATNDDASDALCN